jgi:2-dehydro-3-deoxygluconokinase
MVDLDVIGIGSMMGELSPPRAGVRISESADELVLTPSGSATIFVTALAALGARVGFISRVGDDELGRWMIRELTELGVDTSQIRAVPGQLTPLALASVDDDGNKRFAFYRFPGTCAPLATLTAEELREDFLGRGRVFDLTEGSLRSPELRGVSFAIAQKAKALGALVCFNPNYRADGWTGGAEEARTVLVNGLALADLAIMNADEARMIARQPQLGAAMQSLAAMGPALVVVTDGAEAVHLLDRGNATVLPIPPAGVVFDVGAGDVFHAGFLAVWRPGKDVIRCAQFAAAASALKISREPAIGNLPSAREVRARLLEVDPSWKMP